MAMASQEVMRPACVCVRDRDGWMTLGSVQREKVIDDVQQKWKARGEAKTNTRDAKSVCVLLAMDWFNFCCKMWCITGAQGSVRCHGSLFSNMQNCF